MTKLIMKRLFYFLSVIVLLCGCDRNQDEMLPDAGQEDNTVVEIGELPEVIRVSMAAEQDGAATRTYLQGNKVLWHNGDAISYFSGNMHNVKYSYQGEDGGESVELNKNVNKDGQVVGTNGALIFRSKAVFPYNENITVVYDAEKGVDMINLNYPTTQKYGEKTFGRDANIMVASGETNMDADLYFRNACGYLVIKLYGEDTNGQVTSVKRITLSSVSGVDKIAGSAVVVADSEAAPVITMAEDASTSVVLDCGEGVNLGKNAENATEFWFCLPPVTFTDGIKITVDDIYGNTYTKQASKEIAIERNIVKPMAALQFVCNAPAANKLWYTRSDESEEPLSFSKGAFNTDDYTQSWDSTLGQYVIEFTTPLTTIKKFAFEDCNVATITMPEGVITIEESAFEGSALREITIPGSMANINVNAFYDCAELESVTFLPSATNTPLNICHMSYGYEWGPFYDTKLTTINLNRELNYVDEDGDPYNPTEVDEGMFYHKNFEGVGTVSVVIGPQVKSLSNKMFNYLPIQEIVFPGTLTSVGNNVFEGCDMLTTVTFEPSADGSPLAMGFYDASDDEGPFYSCPLVTVSLNRDIDYKFGNPNDDPEGLFGGKTTLTTVTLGEQVKTLTNNMFADAAITEIVIPGSVNTIGNDVFHQCTSLARVTFEPSATGTPLTMGYDTDGEAENLFQDNNSLTTLVLDREIIQTQTGVDSNSEGLFGGMSTLSSITLGEQVKTLSPHMFAGSGITSLDLNKVETIQNNALAGLALTSLTVPGSVNTIGNDVFYQCTSLAEVTFEPSATGTPLTMGYDTDGEAENLFQDNNSLTTLVLDRDIIQTQTGVDSNSEGLFGGMSTLSSITLGEQVKTLSNFMFAGSSIEELVIPGNMMTIGSSVFEDCEKLATITFEPSSDGKELTIGTNGGFSPFYDSPLTTVNLYREMKYPTAGQTASGLFGGKKDLVNLTIGEQVKTLSPYMFAGSGLTTINLNKVETIKDRALSGLALTSLTIPGGVNTIGDSVFAGCNKLVTITFEPSTDGKALAIDSSGGYSPFCNSPLTTLNLNRELKYLIIPDKDTSGMFALNENLTKVTLGDQVKTLSPYMFTGSGLTSLDLNKVETIEKRALSRLALTSLTIPGSVKTIGNNVFEECTALKELTFNPNNKGEALKIGFYDAIDDKGPFYDTPLTTINLNRELDYDFGGATPDDAAEGVFGGKAELATVTLGSQVKDLSPFMFAESAITALDLNQVESIGKNALAKADFTDLTIPATTSFIDDNAFLDCDKLANLTFAANESKELTIGFQPGTDERGPFYQSPLAFINLDRELVMNEDYAANCDEWDEGIFSNEYYDNEALTAQIYLGNNVHTIHPYMFSTLRMEQLHLPKSIDKIGEKDKNVVERCNKLNAIVFYDDEVRPEVADNAFGNKETLQNYNYFLFMPRYSVDVQDNSVSLYYTDATDNGTYWHTLGEVMVDSSHEYIHQPHVHKGNGIYVQRYYDTVNKKAQPGYEWYVARYCGQYDENTYVDITPPVAPAE